MVIAKKDHHLSPFQINLIIVTILSFYPLVGMGIDLISPCLPIIQKQLNISHSLTKLLITLYLLGYALGNFVIGFLADALGRKKLLVTGTLSFVLASFGIALFPTIIVLLICRFIQGMSIASVAVLGRAIFSDVLEPEELVHMGPFISMMWGIGPILGPVIGAYLEKFINWQACFYFYALFSLLGLIMIFFLIAETNIKPHPFNIKQFKKNFITVVTNSSFLGLVTIMGLAYSLLIVFNVLGPFLIQNTFQKTPIFFGHIALCLGVTYLLGSFFCRYLIKKFPINTILKTTILFYLFLTLICAIISYFFSNNLWFLISLSLCLFFGCGILYPAAMSKGLVIFQTLAGSSAAIMNLVNILITAISAFLMGFINATNIFSLLTIYFVLIILCALSYYFLVIKSQKTS